MQLSRLVIDHPMFSTSPNDHLHPETSSFQTPEATKFSRDFKLKYPHLIPCTCTISRCGNISLQNPEATTLHPERFPLQLPSKQTFQRAVRPKTPNVPFQKVPQRNTASNATSFAVLTTCWSDSHSCFSARFKCLRSGKWATDNLFEGRIS